MATINPSYSRLSAGYLFPEIARRTRAFLAEHPGGRRCCDSASATRPSRSRPPCWPGSTVASICWATPATYSGYGDSEGIGELREALAAHYRALGADARADDVHVSDGAKSDSANIQSVFATGNVVAVQDPAYPVYVDSNVIAGRTGAAVDGCYEGLIYMPCTEANGFFPALPEGKVDLIYLCSPNNPTGAVATREQLRGFVDYARERRAVILFDSAYSVFITDPELPRSIYEIEGARECAIEISSFSKWAGFTGVRLGWTLVPEELVVEGTAPGEVKGLWTRRQNTCFNGASNVVQHGGLAVLSEEGRAQTGETVAFYMENARLIREGLESVGLVCHGGVNAPYVWMRTPEGLGSWEFFDKLLSECGVVGTPGAGFGPSGEGYFRLSAFGSRENVERAVGSIQANLGLTGNKE